MLVHQYLVSDTALRPCLFISTCVNRSHVLQAIHLTHVFVVLIMPRMTNVDLTECQELYISLRNLNRYRNLYPAQY